MTESTESALLCVGRKNTPSKIGLMEPSTNHANGILPSTDLIGSREQDFALPGCLHGFVEGNDELMLFRFLVDQPYRIHRFIQSW